jgi:hypothetical protein
VTDGFTTPIADRIFNTTGEPMHNENTRNPLEAEFDAIVNSHRGRITKRELVPRLSKILKRVDDALLLRRVENAKSGRDAAEDDLLAALEIAVLELLRLGAMTTPR